LSFAKSNLIKELADSYPNFLRKDLVRLIDITLYEMISALKRGERVELRDMFTLEPRTQKSGFKRNPKNGATFFAKEKKKILFKISKSWSKKINEKK
jgi:nucleoid DNA-binding protein|tara:strand:- start:1545 stop:1835 length:291 start_codon:yes stop_codon:yes gene_type:complete